MARPTISAFLTQARAALTAPPFSRPTPLTFVIGNESADLDSLCSSLLLAYLRSHTPPHRLHIPLAQIPRADITLRPEFSAVLQYVGVKDEDVITLSDIPPALKPDETQWFLVDHNTPVGVLGPNSALAEGKSNVIGVIDHRQDEDAIQVKQGGPRMIEKAGSCASLVTRHAADAWTEISSEEGSSNIAAQLAHLALAPILIDTNSLKSMDKTTDVDVWAVEFAEQKLKCSEAAFSSFAPMTYHRDTYHTKVAEIKEDCSRMSFRDIWRKDYKQWTDEGMQLGISTAPQPFDSLLKKERVGGEGDLVDELKKWGGEKQVDIVVAMTTGHPGGIFQRELMVWARNSRAVKIVEAFIEKEKEELQLEQWGNGLLDGDRQTDDWRICWHQKNTMASRKQIAPKLRTAIQSTAKP